ncbi:MAG: TylF/MycF/NovP-related O-methyltransferase [Alphaproteobacteria bacterium]
MILEVSEAFNPDLIHAAAIGTTRVRNAFNRLARHGLVYGVMPAINFLSRRAFVQSRPAQYADRFEDILALQLQWETGRKGSYRGDYTRLYFLICNIEALEEQGIDGAFAELGVYGGNSAKVLRRLAPGRKLYLFDTFAGFPDRHASDDPGDVAAGDYACSLDQVRRFVGDDPEVTYCQGIFPETAALVPEDVRFALVHLDCDLYVPTRAALEFFYPRMTPGGIMILHDYCSGCWAGVPRAVDEFLSDKPEGLVRIPDKSGTAAFVKLRSNSKTIQKDDTDSGCN